MCSLSIFMSLRSNSEMRSWSPPSHWKVTVSASDFQRSLKESLVPHIFRIFPKESTFIPRLVGRSHLNSEKADSLSMRDTSATWELSIDCTCRPFSLHSKFTSLHRSFIASTTFFSRTACCNCISSAMVAVFKEQERTRQMNA